MISKYEKPEILYAMVRTRSTAILQASKKRQITEPFGRGRWIAEKYITQDEILSVSESDKNISDEEELQKMTLDFEWQKKIPLEAWQKLQKLMDDKNTITKILALQLSEFDLAKRWFYDIQNKDSHNIFVVYRNLEEICWSYIIAVHNGFYKHTELNLDKFTVHKCTLNILETQILQFLHHLPKNAMLLSWENLPEKYFDKSRVILSEQFSKNKINKIQNYDMCKYSIDKLIEKYQPRIESEVLSLPWVK